MSEKKEEVYRTSIGGQAIMEGVMMRGPKKACIAVRNPQGEIVIEDLRSEERFAAVKHIPVVRGVFNFVASLIVGYKAIDRSTEIALSDEELEPTKFEKWLDRKFGGAGTKIITTITVIFGVVLALGLFIGLPMLIAEGIKALTGWNMGYFQHLFEGVIRIAVFIGYIALVRLMPDIKRLFAYHGAEHKTIFAYEHGKELTVENVRPESRFHPRCGTSFLLVVMVVSILVNSVVKVSATLPRIACHLALLPLVVGISYEINRWCGMHDNKLSAFLSAPGKWLQRITTVEPDDSMIECAIRAMELVIPDEKGTDEWGK